MEVEDRVRRYGREVVSDRARGALTAVARFGGGDRHAVLKVTCAAAGPGGAGDLVVRVSARSDTAEREQAARAAAVLAALDGSAAPRLLDPATSTSGVSCSPAISRSSAGRCRSRPGPASTGPWRRR